MAKPSIALACLAAIEGILPEARALYLQAGDKGMMSFEIIVGELKGLEAMAQARVEENAYQQHRRVLDACHVTAEIPEARSGR